MFYDIFLKTYPIVLTSFLSYVVWLLQQQRRERREEAIENEKRLKIESEKRDANSEGLKCLLRVQLIEYHDKYMKKGFIPSYAYQNFDEMYNSYRALGGNGMIVHMKKEIDELHLKKSEE